MAIQLPKPYWGRGANSSICTCNNTSGNISIDMKTLYMTKFKYKGVWYYKIGYATNFEYRKKRLKEALTSNKIRAKLHTCFAIKIPFAKEIEIAIHAYLQMRDYRYKHNLPRTISGWTEIYTFLPK